ncbi:MAG: hypothetical protein A3G23_01685 [Bacteroidetes bacterium RIFCSPLOWO2_12_FULL_37_12]|nr:MAG: hypothetical protein A3G23_01685 [Bacteroidetes bacterium RIFCSPLOWO2_12_FULL_37_12]
MEYVQILTRWIHVIAGIMWVGATLVFMRMERNLISTNDPELEGQEDQIHGGGIWRMMKYKTIPQGSKRLHWFMYESLVTYITGAIMLITVYWFGGLMTEMESEMTEMESALYAGVIVFGSVLLYFLLWQWVKPGKSEVVMMLCSFMLTMLIAWILCKLFSGRAAFLHLGAIYGTIMVSNVWFIILPSQQKMVKAIQSGQKPDDLLAKRAGRASTHNTYMMVPLVLLMISNHYPVGLYGMNHNWLVLSAVVMIGWAGGHLIRKKF